MSDKWEFEYRKCKDFVVDKMTDEEYIAFIDKEKKKIDEAIDEYNAKKIKQAEEMIAECKAMGVKEDELVFFCNMTYAYGLPLKHKDGENFNTLLDIPIAIYHKVPDGALMLAHIKDVENWQKVKTAKLEDYFKNAKSVLVPDMKGLTDGNS